ncbi:hypothetical protein ABW20_dc0100085 [Dactylellina cionopaga]|nr:hypothetical protein ABW20_dc0100085 [Dactylellina cionopaga]
MPLTRSAYLEKSDIFNETSGFSEPFYRTVCILEEPSVASSDTCQPEIKSINIRGTSFTEKMRRLLVKIRESMSLEAVDASASEAIKRKAALEFKAGLRRIDEDSRSIPFNFDDQIPSVAFPPAGYDGLSMSIALEDAMANSLIVEGEEEDKEPQEDLINISLEVRRNVDGTEIRFLLIDDLEIEMQPGIFGLP